jgi:hypothetical protein
MLQLEVLEPELRDAHMITRPSLNSVRIAADGAP